MYKSLGRQLHGKEVLIDGIDLLRIVQKYCNRKVDATRAISCVGEGTATEPWRPTSIQQWFELACHVKKNKAVQYFCVAGRLIRRDIQHDLYFSDVGPAWKKWDPDADVAAIATANTTAELNRHAAAAAFLHGDAERFLEDANAADAHAADLQHRIDRNKQLAFNGSVAPTYRVGAQIMRSPENALPQNAAWAAQAKASLGKAWQVATPLTWNDAARQPAVIQAIRNMLSGKAIPLSKDYSRLQTALPVFVCAMFIAEPARNIRAFLINLILLDLAERRDFTIGEMFWHPEALNVDSALAKTPDWNGHNFVAAEVHGPVVTRTNLDRVTTLGQLHLVGGIMPASPTNGGAKGKVEALVGSQASSKAPKMDVDYIHMKEVSVLLQWIALKCPLWRARLDGLADDSLSPPFAAIVHSHHASAPKIPKKFFGTADLGVAELTSALVALDSAIKDRLASADQQL
ncbi:hypothetical protein [Jeongeupia chitinilytica]|uniref:Uncharacterized protein n=1 Tax=Jeongeupia chitinilytica TaxID=1041641 RepID=A0ABQ3GYX0_9NEIS|nr:hypothetical protein [Jeongeupia chitinilytica]GHD60410.1 hypothetical protein GCM10007350_13400 [Jeongeupia chitinilytica]